SRRTPGGDTGIECGLQGAGQFNLLERMSRAESDWMTIPRKRLISGMGARALAVGRKIFGLSPGHPQPKGIRAEVKLLVPSQLAKFPDVGAAEVVVILPRRINTGVRFIREVHLAFHAVVEAEPDAIMIEDFQADDFFNKHTKNYTSHEICSTLHSADP